MTTELHLILRAAAATPNAARSPFARLHSRNGSFLDPKQHLQVALLIAEAEVSALPWRRNAASRLARPRRVLFCANILRACLLAREAWPPRCTSYGTTLPQNAATPLSPSLIGKPASHPLVTGARFDAAVRRGVWVRAYPSRCE